MKSSKVKFYRFTCIHKRIGGRFYRWFYSVIFKPPYISIVVVYSIITLKTLVVYHFITTYFVLFQVLCVPVFDIRMFVSPWVARIVSGSLRRFNLHRPYLSSSSTDLLLSLVGFLFSTLSTTLKNLFHSPVHPSPSYA